MYTYRKHLQIGMAIRNMLRMDPTVLEHEKLMENLALVVTYRAFMWLCEHEHIKADNEIAVLADTQVEFEQFLATLIAALQFADQAFPTALGTYLVDLFGSGLLSLSSKPNDVKDMNDDIRKRRNNFGYNVRYVIYRFTIRRTVNDLFKTNHICTIHCPLARQMSSSH